MIRGCSDDYILVSLLARMGCVFSGKVKVALTSKTGWQASPNFFWAMIGDPSSGKSNALSATNKPIQLLSENAREKYKKEILLVNNEAHRFAIGFLRQKTKII